MLYRTKKWKTNLAVEDSSVQRCVRESPDWTHFNLFPRSLGEILAQYSVQELRLSLTQVEIIQGTID